MVLTSNAGDPETSTLWRFRVLWACPLGLSFVLAVFASFRGGYIGPDYDTHFARLTEWPKIFDFSTTSPPTYYLVGHALFLFIRSNDAFPLALSIAQAVVNTLVMCWFFLYTERRFNSPLIHLGFAFFLAFLPVRIIHATTIPLFVLLLFLFDRFLSDESSTVKNAGLLGLGLALAVWTKYSFMALIPAIFLLLIGIWARRGWKFRRFIATCALGLVLPSALALHSFGQAAGYVATTPKSIGWRKVSRLTWITAIFSRSKPTTFSFSVLLNISSARFWRRTGTAISGWYTLLFSLTT